MSNDAALQTMIDQVAIQQLIARYIEAASSGNIEVVGSTYAEDGVWEVPAFPMRVVGPKAIAEKIAELLQPMEYLVQLGSPAAITVNGDTATARSSMREGCKFKGKNVAAEILGVYDDDLVRTADGWKFARRTFQMSCFNTYDVHPPQAS
jgi:ketosteroid isomerase-like protein